MAFREVTLTEEEQKAGQKRFEKFNAIGDTITGVLVRITPTTKTFKVEEGPKTFDTYAFWGPKKGDPKAPADFEISPLPYDLERKIKKAMRPVSEDGMGLVPGMGHLVQMKFDSTLPTGQDSPMYVFKVHVDTEFKPQKELPSHVTWAKRGSPPPQHAAADLDDIPF
jgi:hypothetical protein